MFGKESIGGKAARGPVPARERAGRRTHHGAAEESQRRHSVLMADAFEAAPKVFEAEAGTANDDDNDDDGVEVEPGHTSLDVSHSSMSRHKITRHRSRTSHDATGGGWLGESVDLDSRMLRAKDAIKELDSDDPAHMKRARHLQMVLNFS